MAARTCSIVSTDQASASSYALMQASAASLRSIFGWSAMGASLTSLVAGLGCVLGGDVCGAGETSASAHGPSASLGESSSSKANGPSSARASSTQVAKSLG